MSAETKAAKMTRHVTRSLISGYLLMLSTSASGDLSVSAGAVLGHFDYKESSSSGESLNTERGIVPGIQANLALSLDNEMQVELSGTRFSGDVRYSGQTQTGAPLRTHSDFALTMADLTTRFRPFVVHNLLITPMIRAGFREWQRDILPTDKTLQLSEVYQWLEIGAGGSVCQNLKWKWLDTWCGQGWALYAFEGSVKVDLTEINAGQPLLRLGSMPGALAALSAGVGNTELGVFSHFWQFGRSNPETIYRPFGRLTIEEPASRSWLTGLWISIEF